MRLCGAQCASGPREKYSLVYLVYNTIFNLLTQDEQVRCFENVAEHLTDDGVFVIEAVTWIIQIASFKLTGRRIFRMAPLQHHFELIGWAEEKITIRFWIVGALAGLLGFSLYLATVRGL